MLTVKTKIQESLIHGIGLFADQFIPKGTLIWKLKPGFDIILSEADYKSLPDLTKNFVMHFSHYDTELDCHILCTDHARFFNKAEDPNCVAGHSGTTIAGRDIEQGEELTEIYYNLNELKENEKR